MLCSQAPSKEIYYFNFITGESIWDHPCDERFRWEPRSGYHTQQCVLWLKVGVTRTPDGLPTDTQRATAASTQLVSYCCLCRKLYAQEKERLQERLAAGQDQQHALQQHVAPNKAPQLLLSSGDDAIQHTVVEVCVSVCLCVLYSWVQRNLCQEELLQDLPSRIQQSVCVGAVVVDCEHHQPLR